MSKKRLSRYIKSKDKKLELTLGEVELDKPLGEGGNGLVFEGKIGSKDLALKFLVTDATGNSKDQKVQRFIAEYFNIKMVDDTSDIVKYISYDSLTFQDDEGELSIPLIIMKRYEGSLKAFKDSNKVTVENFQKLFNFLLDSIEKIHDEGIIHRDIKPENILVDKDKFVLADFGIANYNPEIFSIRAETKKGERMGNRLFSAPEQEDGGMEAHPTMDIYALGQVLQWYVTGKTHRGTGRTCLSSKLPELRIYDNIIDRCLENNPRNRFQSIKEIREYQKSSREKDIFSDYMYLFNDICIRNYPRTINGVVHSDNKVRIDKLLYDLNVNLKAFDKHLWWHNGSSNLHLSSINSKGKGEWKLNQKLYKIKEIWMHYDSNVFNDFILLHYESDKPFEVGGKISYYTVIVDNTHHISYEEYENGFAEIGEEVIDLSKHEVELIERMEEEGYLFIGLRYHCVLQGKNDESVRSFIRKVKGSGIVSESEVFEFANTIRSEKHNEVMIRI